jgi:hypothetical protein
MKIGDEPAMNRGVSPDGVVAPPDARLLYALSKDARFGRWIMMRRGIWTFVGLAAMLTPSAATAGGNVKLKEAVYDQWTKPKLGDPLPVGGPVIHVYSEGGDAFDFVGHTNQPVHFWGQFSGTCGRVYKISYLQFQVEGVVASVSHPSSRGKYFSRYGSVEVPYDALVGFDAVRACNDKLKTLAAETGRSKRTLVADGFGIRFPNRIEGLASLQCTGRNNGDNDTEKLDVWVECVGNPKSAEPDKPSMKVVPAKLTPFITDLSYEVDRPSWVGKCPVGLKFTGSISTSRAGTVKYRSVGHDGSTSPTYTLTFRSAGTKSVGTWGETISEPKASATLSAGSSGEGPDASGWRRLEIVQPSGFAPSTPAEYSVTCQQQTMQLKAAPVATPKPARIKK